MRYDQELHAKLLIQVEAGSTELHLTHDEIDRWRAQFDVVIPVSILAFRGIPIVEQN